MVYALPPELPAYSILAQTAPVPPPPAPVEELPPPDKFADREPLDGLSLVTGFGNPEWAHIGAGYRWKWLASTMAVGSVNTTNNVSVSVRGFLHPIGPGAFVEVGLMALRLAQLTDQTPKDIFFEKWLGAGYQFRWGHLISNLSIGLNPFGPPRSAAPPAVLLLWDTLPHFNMEVGYAF